MIEVTCSWRLDLTSLSDVPQFTARRRDRYEFRYKKFLISPLFPHLKRSLIL